MVASSFGPVSGTIWNTIVLVVVADRRGDDVRHVGSLLQLLGDVELQIGGLVVGQPVGLAPGRASPPR